jgi:beta-phosphoglucomutase-like phosphatase (HAD superfamily)
MTAAELLARRASPLRLVIFDCDGVLVDSEPPTNRLTARELTALGWPITPDEVERTFLGMTTGAWYR